MATLASLLPIIQIILAALLVGGVLLQQRGAGLGSVFGGGNDDTTFNTRRGSELFLFRATIVIAIFFAFTAILQLIL